MPRPRPHPKVGGGEWQWIATSVGTDRGGCVVLNNVLGGVMPCVRSRGLWKFFGPLNVGG